MPKKQKQESPEEQSERFRNAVQELIDAGELNPTEAEKRFEDAMKRVAASAEKPST